MPNPIACRPLLLAGAAAVAGVVASRFVAAGPVALMLLPGALWSVHRRAAVLGVVLAGLGAGTVAGARVEARAQRTLRSLGSAWPRAPPWTGVTKLKVIRCGEDPYRDRAWLEGRRRDGVGVLCTWPGTLPAELAAGARVRVSARFFLPRAPGNPGEADRRRDLAARGVLWVADAGTAANVQVEEAAPPHPGRLLGMMRRRAAVRLRETLPPDVAPLATAVLLGLRSGLPPEDRLRFERTGTMHLLAISGMHVLLLAGLVHAILRAAGCGPRTAAAVTLALAISYVPVAGGAAPVRRAVTMLAFYAIALVRGRPPDAASSLGGAALLLALTDPLDVYRVGFRLSFAAAAGIAWLSGPWRHRWSERYHLLRRFPAVRRDRAVRLAAAGYLWQALPVSLAAWLATQGLVARAFGVLTPLAPLTNLAAAPLLALVLPLVALVALGIDAAAGPATLAIRLLRWLLDQMASVPGGFWTIAPPPVLAVVLWTAGAFVLRRSGAVGVLLCALACGHAARADGDSPTDLFVLDVGHGQALLVRFRGGGAVLVDAGSRGRPAVDRRTVLPALHALGVARLDAVVCTHADADHWNALPTLLGRFPVGRVVTGPDPPAQLAAAARAHGVPVVRARRGETVYRNTQGALTVVATDGAGSRNDRSLALLLEIGETKVLLPADREEVGLHTLLVHGVPRCDVLLAPHHGARCREAARFGNAVGPRCLIVSTRRGFADRETLRAYGAPLVLTTAADGCVRVWFPAAGRIEIETFRTRRRATIRAP